MVGKSTGRDSEVHKVLRRFDHLSNELANIGVDILYSLFPFLRFLPFSDSRKIKEWFNLRRQITEIFEEQVVCP
jgi:hypothetical protein